LWGKRTFEEHGRKRRRILISYFTPGKCEKVLELSGRRGVARGFFLEKEDSFRYGLLNILFTRIKLEKGDAGLRWSVSVRGKGGPAFRVSEGDLLE